MEPIILASGSLRRQEYFKLMGLPFSIMPAEFDEDNVGGTDPVKAAQERAIFKVKRVIDLLAGRLPLWIFGADTIVSAGGGIYGKPKDREDAGAMLAALSGREQMVVTAMALYNGKMKKIDCRSVSCTVCFANLSTEEIEWYLDTGEWQEVAGAYRMQGLASLFVKSIHGHPSTVVGLPLHDFYVMLKDNGYSYGG
jgi:septum formation protein